MPSNPVMLNEIESLYRLHAPALLLFASAMTRERTRAQDAVHQVFLKLIESGDLREAVHKKAYLFRCVRNAVLNEAKVQQRNTTLDSDLPWFHPPSQDYIGELSLRRALTTLPGDQREIIVLHIWGELTFSEIADVLAINPNTAASRYRYALTKLRELMYVKEDSCASSR